MQKVHSFTVLPTLPEALKDLQTIAGNMFWCWNPEYSRIFQRIDAKLWEQTGHNPIKLLNTVSQEKLDKLAENQGFIASLSKAVDKLNTYLRSKAPYDYYRGDSDNPVIAYFSAEFGLHGSLPLYAGGLGILAGDHLKSASDLALPLVGVGLLYQKGYFRQTLNIDGLQQEKYAENEFHNMAMELVRDDSGQPLRILVEYPGRIVQAQIWRTRVGRIDLYLLDTNIDENSSADRMTTAMLYGGDIELRIRQEILLGIGGLRALHAVGIDPIVCHMNEGHAAFLSLERILRLKQQSDISFEEAVEATRAGNIFTVHTPVKAGNDEFSPEIIDKYFGDYYHRLGMSREYFLSLGRVFSDDPTETFKMPVLALRLSACSNGVSKLHGEVSRNMWSCLWPAVPVDEVPIDSITNGVHIKSWVSEELGTLYEKYFGLSWADGIADASVWEHIDEIPDEEFWRTHLHAKDHLIAFVRQRAKRQMQRQGTYHSQDHEVENLLNPEILTIGFARRFATYKRGDLLLRDPERLIKLLTDPEKPVQIIFAGKAHPRDREGKQIIQNIIRFAAEHNLQNRLVFLEDYDMSIAKVLVRAVDIWLNNPRRPLEASGTSGMKAAINGAINLSVKDGWWCEGYHPDCGWSIGADSVHEKAEYQDLADFNSLFRVLENEVVPLYYRRSHDNLPRGWIHKMKNSIKLIAPVFNTDRMVGEYAEKFYIPSVARWRRLNDNNLQAARELAQWKQKIHEYWSQVSVNDVEIHHEPKGNNGDTIEVGSRIEVSAKVDMGVLSPEDVRVQAYMGELGAWENMKKGRAFDMQPEKSGSNGQCLFTGKIRCQKAGKQGIAVRVVPYHRNLVNTAEMSLVHWEKHNTLKPVTTPS